MTTPTTSLMQPNLSGLDQVMPLIEDFEKQKFLVMWLNQTYQNMKQQRSTYERKWYISLAFYRGRQNIALINTPASSSGFRLLTPPAPPWRVRMVINKIRPIIRREIAKVVAQKPTFTVVPATNEDEDYYAAKAGEQILEACHSDYGINKINRSRAWWTAICGTGFLKCYWDDRKKVLGRGQINPYTNQPTDVIGDICVQNVMPLHIFVPDLVEQDINNQPYVFHVFTKSKNWIEQYYGTQVASKAKVNSIDAVFLKGSHLRGNTDVRVEAGSALPSSKAAKQAFLMDLFKMGVFAQNPSEFLRILDLRGIDKVLADYKVDIGQAQRENIKLAAGVQVNINDFDNHELHLEYHDRYSKTQEYEMLSDQIKAIIINHRKQHQQAIQVNQMFAARQQQLMGNPQPLPSNGNNPSVGAPQTS